MSIDNVYVVYDKAKNSYLAPFCASTDEESKRFIVQQIGIDSTSFFALYPESFMLYYIGTFDHSKCILSPLEFGDKAITHKSLGTFAQIKKEFDKNVK